MRPAEYKLAVAVLFGIAVVLSALVVGPIANAVQDTITTLGSAL